MRKRGFTLLELMFVISIIAILAAILFPVFARARESARRSTCASNLQQIGVALNMYAQSYDGRYPKKNNEFAPVFRYVGNIDIFYCPSDSAEHYWQLQPAKMAPYSASHFYGPEIPVRTYSSYVYRGGLCNDDRADRVIAGESQTWHGEANVLYLGGYVRTIDAYAYRPVVEPTQKPVEKKAEEPKPAPAPSGAAGRRPSRPQTAPKPVPTPAPAAPVKR